MNKPDHPHADRYITVQCPDCTWVYWGPRTIAGLHEVEQHEWTHHPELLDARLLAAVEASGLRNAA